MDNYQGTGKESATMKQQDHIKNFWNDDVLPWYANRGRYLNFKHRDTLFKFLPQQSYPEKEHLNNPMCAAFWIAVQAEMDHNPHGVMLFALTHTTSYKFMSVKRYLHEQMKDSISRKAAYELAIKTAEKIYSHATMANRMWEMCADENFQFNKHKQAA